MTKPRYSSLINQDDPVWSDLKKHIRMRLAKSVCFLFDTGTIRRSDVVKMNEVSMPTASNDLRLIDERAPGLMIYDNRKKYYRLGVN